MFAVCFQNQETGFKEDYSLKLDKRSQWKTKPESHKEERQFTRATSERAGSCDRSNLQPISLGVDMRKLLWLVMAFSLNPSMGDGGK